MSVTKDSAFGSRFNMYRLKRSAFAYNPTLREWEVFETDDDGSIQDLFCRRKNMEGAFASAIELNNRIVNQK